MLCKEVERLKWEQLQELSAEYSVMERRATASGEYQPHGSSMSLVEESSVAEDVEDGREEPAGTRRMSAAELLGRK